MRQAVTPKRIERDRTVILGLSTGEEEKEGDKEEKGKKVLLVVPRRRETFFTVLHLKLQKQKASVVCLVATIIIFENICVPLPAEISSKAAIVLR